MPQEPKPPNGDWTRAVREAAPLLGLGTSLALTVLLGLGIGYWLDQRLGTSPILVLVGAAFGVAAAGLGFVRSVSRKP